MIEKRSNDRLLFMRFLGLGLSDRVPDAKTIWLFRERLVKVGAHREPVCTDRCHAGRSRLYPDVGTDRRRVIGGGFTPA